ncbi:MAG: LemA family protein [Deltaproteobacteria bacterium]|nr:LemA family protein [Deltaproteobacteria bacterium]
MEALIVPGIVVLVIISLPVMLYNSLVGKKNAVERAFSGMDVSLKQRHDLIPNLVSAVKTFMAHEKGLLTEITELRTRAASGSLSEGERLAVEGQMSKALGGLMVAVENYPDLKSNQNFLQLQAALNEVEEKISAARRNFNGAVESFNNGLEMFPSNIIAGMMRLQKRQMFEIAEAERANVNVGQLFGG